MSNVSATVDATTAAAEFCQLHYSCAQMPNARIECSNDRIITVNLASPQVLFSEVKRCTLPAEAQGRSQRTEEAAQGDEKVTAAAVS